MNDPLTSKIIRHYDLSECNTMALSCFATHAMVLDNADTLTDDINSAMSFAHQNHLSIFVLSGGSNVLLPKHLNALVLLPRFKCIDVISQDDTHVVIKVGCGENWHDFVKQCLENGWHGLENLALIPGLVGASPVQNIGAYGVQVSDFIKTVFAFDLTTGNCVAFDNEACEFGYRHSFFKEYPNRYLISHVVFKLHKSCQKTMTSYGDLSTISTDIAHRHGRTKPHPHDVFKAVVQIRQEKLPNPSILANCGSFFQNPIIPMETFHQLKAVHPDLPSYPIDDDVIKIPAGWLIDRAGLKGKGIAPILTHEKQALVLTNHAPQIATQNDILQAQNFIIDAVFKIFGVRLVREPVWVHEDGG
ncbi:UDP-N-acetylmuramate dehydrogenase [Moraxella sp. Tifton1]|uniref:UDP-N-acetylmuramate dehydrogenase n=1 Tax=Moraxella oculi TaxID=2940516 RepID=UPI0020127CA3|nr:UDP-N-acetylmuramate dehydrogenase [Moraxella sp. Tifton1]MCL1623616.1 UDP-N-acetylmuramate dehydrogenase [Moraxella sp. Tifton1]